MAKQFKIKEPNAPMTHKQGWAIYCLSKRDAREMNLTRKQASDIISALKSGEEVPWPDGKSVGTGEKRKPRKTAGEVVFESLLKKAHEAGQAAAEACTPRPMVVQQHANQLDDNSEVVKEWYVPTGVCGFAWVNFKVKSGNSRKFLSFLKKKGLAGDINSHAEWHKDSYYGGYTKWISDYGQSMELKAAYANAYAAVLHDAGISAYGHSRMD